ncbi:hypothetical protein [uncultured Bifidobacterium sp.]|jgi:hypothetical protein|uniref:hypothetical protein n=1 Tax=uncultured Bifidobacterium sp. TaxID=165187 RepID=UPI00259086A6|nr:hypothetical protein [uncultured Bifidobacterium sp.]
MKRRTHTDRDPSENGRRALAVAIIAIIWCVTAMTVIWIILLGCIIIPTTKAALLFWWLASAA